METLSQQMWENPRQRIWYVDSGKSRMAGKDYPTAVSP